MPTITPVAFNVASESLDQITYRVTIAPCGCCISCTCPDYVHRHHRRPGYACKHIDDVRTWLRADPHRALGLAHALIEALTDAADPCAAPPRPRPPAPCACACNTADGTCGGCGHAGCGRRR